MLRLIQLHLNKELPLIQMEMFMIRLAQLCKMVIALFLNYGITK